MIMHPLMGASFNTLVSLYANNHFDLKKTPKILFSIAMCLLTTHLRVQEKALYRNKVQLLAVRPPIFIIGHHRSGTTHLLNILSNDLQFSYITFEQTVFPNILLISRKKFSIPHWFLQKFGPKKRPADNMAVTPESPQQDERALANMCLYSIEHGFCFMRNFNKFLKFLSFNGATDSEIKTWQTNLLILYKKLTYLNNNKIILSKNPSHTGRIKQLLELFPNAKFIHIYRNPYKVYLSTLKMLEVINKTIALSPLNTEELSDIALTMYKDTMHRFFADKSLIPKKNLVEIQYEKLEQNPMDEIKRIYEELELENFSLSKEKIQSYLDGVKDYKKSKYVFSKELINLIYENFHFTIDKWGYHPND